MTLTFDMDRAYKDIAFIVEALLTRLPDLAPSLLVYRRILEACASVAGARAGARKAARANRRAGGGRKGWLSTARVGSRQEAAEAAATGDAAWLAIR